MENPKLVAASAIAVAATLAILFTLRPLASKLGLVDKPDERKWHRGAVPLIGGLSFFGGTLAGVLYLGQTDRFVICLMVAAFAIVLVGAMDDMRDLGVRLRLAVQACAAGLVIGFTGVYIESSGVLFHGQSIEFGIIGVPLTVVAVMGLINAFNMQDGIDGLAGGLALISIAAILAFSGLGQQMFSVVMLLQILSLALVPYLLANMGWPDGRKVFMGDAGSTLIGFLLAWSLIYLSRPQAPGAMEPVDMLWCVAVPVLETAAVMCRRMRRGLSPFRPDRRHIHHMLLDAGLSARVTLGVILAAAGLLALIGYTLRAQPGIVSLIAFAVIAALYIVVTDRLPVGNRRSQDNHVAGDKAVTELNHRQAPALNALCVVETQRDAAILAPVVNRMQNDHRFDVTVYITEHDQLESGRLLNLLELKSDVTLEPSLPRDKDMAVSCDVTGVVQKLRPDIVLLSAGAQAAKAVSAVAGNHQIAVAHIRAQVAATQQQGAGKGRREPGMRESYLGQSYVQESGLRESVPRTALHPTLAPRAVRAGKAGVHEPAVGEIVVVGNTAAQALRTILGKIEHEPTLGRELAQRFSFLRDECPLLLVGGIFEEDHEIIHRALLRVADRRPDVDIVWLAANKEFNQHVVNEHATNEHAASSPPSNLHQLEAGDYLGYAFLLNTAYLVLTDSVEVEHEASDLACAVLSVRDASWREPVDSDLDSGRERAVAESVITLLGNRQIHAALQPATSGSGAVGGAVGSDPSAGIVETLASLQLADNFPEFKPQVAA